MGGDQESNDLNQLLDRIDDSATDNEHVTVEEILDAVGRRSFGPLLLVAGLVTLAPLIGDIPGVPTIMGVTVFLIAVQLLVGRQQFWLPRWLLDRSISADKLTRAVQRMRKPARFVDRFVRARLTPLTTGPMIRVIAVVCMLIAMAMPPMELVPFSANGAGAALTAFGLALIARDGVLALLAFGFTALTATLIVVNVG